MGVGLEHARLEPHPADEIARDHVRRLGEIHFGGMLHQEDDAIGQPVGARERPCHFDHAVGFDRVDAGGAGAAREHPEDSSARAEVDDDVTGSDGRGDRALVRLHAGRIRQVFAVRVDDERHALADRYRQAALLNVDAPGASCWLVRVPWVSLATEPYSVRRGGA